MCVFFPLALGLMAAIWAFPVSAGLAVAWDLALLVALGVLVSRMRKAPDRLGGIPVAQLAGRPCPCCASTNTVPWMSGRTPLGVHCQACDRRTPGVVPLRPSAGGGAQSRQRLGGGRPPGREPGARGPAGG